MALSLNQILAAGATPVPGTLSFELTLDGADVVDGRTIIPSAETGSGAALTCSVPDLTVPAGATDPHVFTFEVDATGLATGEDVKVEVREGLAPAPLISEIITLVAPVILRPPPPPPPPPPVPPTPPTTTAAPSGPPVYQIGFLNQWFGGGGTGTSTGAGAAAGSKWQAFFAALPWLGLMLGFLSVILCVVGLVFSLVIGGFGMLMVGISNDAASSGMHCTTETVGVVVDEEGRIIEPGTTTTECQNPDPTSIAEFLDTLGWTAPPG